MFQVTGFQPNAFQHSGESVAPVVTTRKKGAAGAADTFRRARAQVVVNGKVFEVKTKEEAQRVVQSAVDKAKAQAKKLAPKAKTVEEVPMPPTVWVDYTAEIEGLRAMVEEANRRIQEAYAREFARAIVEMQRDEEEVTILLLH